MCGFAYFEEGRLRPSPLTLKKHEYEKSGVTTAGVLEMVRQAAREGVAAETGWGEAEASSVSEGVCSMSAPC